MTSKNQAVTKFETFLHSHFMHGVIVLLVALNAVVLGLKTSPDIYLSFGKPLDLIDLLTVLFLATVVFVRWIQLGGNFLKNGWNLFDAIVITISLGGYFLNYEILQPFRILMLFRLAELYPSMKILIDALFRSLSGLASSVIILFITFYIFGYIGYFTFGAHLSQDFGSLTRAMSTLMSLMTFDDFRSITHQMERVSPFAWLYVILFLFCSAFSFLNLLIGVVVQAMADATHHARRKS